MVAVPKSFWKASNYKSRIKYLLYHVSIIEEKLSELRTGLSHSLEDLHTLTVGADLQPYLNVINAEVAQFKENNPKFDSECASYSTLHSVQREDSESIIDISNVSLDKLETYRSKFKMNFGDYERIHEMLEYNIRQTMKFQARVNARESEEYWRNNLKAIQKIKYSYLIYIHPTVLRIMAVLTGFLSLALLYAEFTNFIRFEFSFFSWIFDRDLGYFLTYLLMFLPLSYMLTCTYYGLFSVKLASWYELYKGHSDPVSMIWSGTIFARLIYPMSYNFITIMKVNNTNYAKVLGILEDFNLLGKGMNRYFFPVVLLIFFLMNLLDLWSRLFGK